MTIELLIYLGDIAATVMLLAALRIAVKELRRDHVVVEAVVTYIRGGFLTPRPIETRELPALKPRGE